MALADAAQAHQAQDASPAPVHLVDQLPDAGQLGLSAHRWIDPGGGHGQGEGPGLQDLEHLQRRGPALEADGSQRGQAEAISHGMGNPRADQDLAGPGQGHQARGQVDLVSQHPVGGAGGRAIGADPHAPPTDADLHRLDRTVRGWGAQDMGRGHGPEGIVVVGHRCAESRVEVTALLADGELDQGPLVAGQYLLHPAHKAVQVVAGLGVAVVDALKAQEKGCGRPQLGQEMVLRGVESFIDGRLDPGPGLLGRDRGEGVPGRRRRRHPGQGLHQEDVPLWGRADSGILTKSRGGTGIQRQLALFELGLGRVQSGHEFPGQDVQALDGRITHQEATHFPLHHADLDAQGDGVLCGDGDGLKGGHGLLHGQAGGQGQVDTPICGWGHGVVEPTGDGVAAEADDAAAPGVDVVDQGAVDPVQVIGQLLCTATGTVGAQEGLGQGSETGDVGEKGRAPAFLRQGCTARQCMAAVQGDVGQARIHAGIIPGSAPWG